ncbi:MAG: alpha/beta fold hydrolase [Gemmatimonadota bacterium]|nr:alpha/beta fold hydrolase [Gemmatimonadota bacterium]
MTDSRHRELPPVVLIHGFTGAAASWSPELRAGLGGEGRGVVPLDLPGHGARAGDGAEGMDLDAVLAGIGSAVPGTFDLVGYSMGARVALHFAVRFPGRVRRLVLESGSPGLASARERARRREADERLAERIEEDGVGAFVADWRRNPVLAPGPRRAPTADRRAERIRRGNRAHGLAGALRTLGTGALPSLWDRLPALAAPTLLLVGALDSKFVAIAERMERSIPAATLEVVPDAGHTVHLDRPEAWLTAVRGHLGRGPEVD